MEDLTVDYSYREIVIGEKTYYLPIDCEPGSRRWNFWIFWQDRNLPIPAFKPRRVLITRTGAALA